MLQGRLISVAMTMLLESYLNQLFAKLDTFSVYKLDCTDLMHCQIRGTMKNIREVLADRQLSWDQAQKIIGQKAIIEVLPDRNPFDEYEEDQTTPAEEIHNLRRTTA